MIEVYKLLTKENRLITSSSSNRTLMTWESMGWRSRLDIMEFLIIHHSFFFISGWRPYAEQAKTVKIKDGQTTTDMKYYIELQSTCGQRLESSPGDSYESKVCQCLYDRNYVSDMDDRSRWAWQSINQQVTSNYIS